MSADEFVEDARHWEALLDLEPTRAIASACRGSGNPATLAWLAEALELDADATIVDIGGGLGGPAAWLSTHYQCRVVAADPVPDAIRCAHRVFSLPAVVARGTHLPVRDQSFDVGLVLGVLSVVDDPVALLREARRVAARLGVLAYLSTSDRRVRCGGSVFPTRSEFDAQMRDSGWVVDVDPTATSVAPPPSWDTDDRVDDADEAAVADAIEAGRIEPFAAVAVEDDAPS